MAEDALNCLSTLLDSVPGWITDLENILRSATERQKEILFENQPADETQPIDSFHDRPRKKSKSSSVRSKISGRQEVAPVGDLAATETAAAVQVQEQRPYMTQSDELRLAQRKRKTASVCSGRDEGPYKYRSRAMVVIYYDGETQKQFETMVRDVSGCRNALRKGKMGARLDMMSQKCLKEDGDSDEPLEIPRIAFRSTRQSPRVASDHTKAFDQLDTLLEKAQMMCERAAHQVLRDGDCALEIRHAKQHFSEAKSLADAELVKWKKKADDEAEKKRIEPVKVESVEPEEPPAWLVSTVAPPKAQVEPAASLEADDSDSGGDEDFTVDLGSIGAAYVKRAFGSQVGLMA